MSMPYFAPLPPRIFGHRGAAGTAPENTLPSFALAATLGATYLELDVRATRDGIPVVLHDATLDRTTDGSGPVAAHTWTQVAGLDAGYRFTTDGEWFPYRGQGVRLPTLESVLRGFPDRHFNIEIKQAQPPIVEAVIDLVERTDTAGRVLLAAEEDSIMQAIRGTVGQHMATGISSAEASAFFGRLAQEDWQGYQPPGQALQIPATYQGIELVTPASVAAAHRFGVEVHVWTINDSAEIERLFDLGVDGIMSDLPGLVSEAVSRRRLCSRR